MVKNEKDFLFCKSILNSLFIDKTPVEKTLSRFSEHQNGKLINVNERICGLMKRCGNINAVREFLVYLVFETYVESEEDPYIMAYLGEFEPILNSYITNSLTSKYRKRLLHGLRWQFCRVKKISEYIMSLKKKEDHNVLDLGCGFGQLSYLLAKEGMSITALDLDVEFALKLQNQLKEKLPYTQNVKFISGNALDLSEIDTDFDFVTLADVVEHIIEKRTLFQQVHKVLKTKGKVFINTDNLHKLQLVFFAKRLLYMVTFKNPLSYNHAWSGGERGHIGLTTPENLKKLLNEINFECKYHYVKTSKLSTLIPPIFASSFLMTGVKN